jgi:hypothetical protein
VQKIWKENVVGSLWDTHFVFELFGADGKRGLPTFRDYVPNFVFKLII